MDAIECGIVKLPRVPVADNIPGSDMPKFRNLWKHVGRRMPRKGRGKAAGLDPLSLPVELQTALQALYGHYEKQFELWQAAGIEVPPCFIVVCNNTSTLKLVYDKTHRYRTDARRCHVNWVILDSDWEAEFCRVAESHPRVRAYVKNQGLGLEVPYRSGSATRTYVPDFIVLLDDGRGDPLPLIVEIKGYRREDAKAKKETMETYWIPGANNLRAYGRLAFAEFTAVYDMQSDFAAMVEAAEGFWNSHYNSAH